MVTVRIPGGPGGARLAAMLQEENPDSSWRAVPGDGIEVQGPRIEVQRWMVERAYWPAEEPDPRAAERFLRYLVRADQKTIRLQAADRIVVADESEAGQALLVRFPAAVKERLAETAEKLGMSQNEMVVRAVEDLLRFVAEFGGERPG